MPRELKNINRILLVRNDRFGEFLLNIPVAVVLKKIFPSSEITLVVKPQVEGLARRIPVADKVLLWDSLIVHTIRQKLCFLGNIKSRKFDLTLILNPSKEFNIYAYLSGIPLRAGYDRKLGFLLNCKVEDKKYEGLRHEVDYNLDLLRVIGINAEP